MPLVSTIYQVLTTPTDELDQVTANDKKMLQRSYYLFICTIVANDVLDVLKNQGKIQAMKIYYAYELHITVCTTKIKVVIVLFFFFYLY